MEDGLVLADGHKWVSAGYFCLNPCCDGRWSRTSTPMLVPQLLLTCLNPCCDGRWSRTEGTVCYASPL